MEWPPDGLTTTHVDDDSREPEIEKARECEPIESKNPAEAGF